MARPAIWLFTLALVADAILVNGRPSRFPSAQGKEVLEVVRVARFHPVTLSDWLKRTLGDQGAREP